MAETTEPPDTDPKGGYSQSDVAAEFRNLGQNLKSVLQTAWDSDERKKLQEEIEAGLADLNRSLDQAVSEFRESPAGQRLKEDVADLSGRIRTGQVEEEIRVGLLSVLRSIDQELENASKSESHSYSEGSSKEG